MKLTGLLRSGLTLILLGLNFVVPFLAEMSPPRVGAEAGRMIAVNHYLQMTALVLVWLLARSGRQTNLYLSLTAVSILAVGIMGRHSAFSMTLGWGLTTLVAAEAASRLTRRVRDRRAAAAAASVMMNELQRDRSLAALKLLIGLTALIDVLVAVIFCLRPGFAEGGFNSMWRPTLAATALAAFPALLMVAGERRPELTALAALTALTGLAVDLGLMYYLWGLHWGDFLRMSLSLETHLTLVRHSAQAGAVLALGVISVRRARELAAREPKAGRPAGSDGSAKAPESDLPKAGERFGPNPAEPPDPGRCSGGAPPLQSLDAISFLQGLTRVGPRRAFKLRLIWFFPALTLLAAGLAALFLTVGDRLGPDGGDRRPWTGAAVDRGLGRVALQVPEDWPAAGGQAFGLSRNHREIKFTECCGPGSAGVFDLAPPQSNKRLIIIDDDYSADFGRPARLLIQADRRPDGTGSRRLILTLLAGLEGDGAILPATDPAPPGSGGRLEIFAEYEPLDENFEAQAENFRSDLPAHRRRPDGVRLPPGLERPAGRFLKSAGEFLAAYHWAGDRGSGRAGDFRTRCGSVSEGPYQLSGQLDFTGERSVLTLGCGGWFGDSAPSFPALSRELESLYETGRLRDVYRLRTAAGRPGVEVISRDADPESPGSARLTLTWRPDDAQEFPVLLRLRTRLDPGDAPNQEREILSRWEAALTSLRPAE